MMNKKRNLEQKAKEKRKYLIEIGRYRTQSQLSLSLLRLPNALRLRSHRVRRFLRVKNDEQRKGDLKKFIVCLSCFIAKMLSFHNPFAETKRGKPRKTRVIEMSLHSELCAKFWLDTQVIDASVPRPIGEMSRVSDSARIQICCAVALSCSLIVVLSVV